ncbi:MAG: hypothetical protein AB7E72_13705 [Lysobacterales bacterium]
MSTTPRSAPPISTGSLARHTGLITPSIARAHLISSHRTADAVLVLIDDNGVERTILVTLADQPELSVLSVAARAYVRSAVLAMRRTMHGGPNEAHG